MTRLYNEPSDFAAEMTEGFVAANPQYVRSVHGGVVRSTRVADGTPALVVGGGSGHYPAFAGLVGPGLAHGAVMGDLFASPSAQQVHTVATAVESGGGVLLSYGNYAGDVLNFDAAERRLRVEGVAVETVRVTDDISSAPRDEKENRRGIAGDLVVFKVAGAAAEAGADLAATARVARRANERTRSFGVAFSGCTLPGAPEPLFTVPEGRMGVGMGIHGEPGIDETDVPTADGLAALLVSALLDELPDGVDTVRGARVVPLLNGLGAVKYEELFVVYRAVSRLLAEAGAEVIDPHVGEFCTSFDMAGASLTLFWPDAELEDLWTAPADTPAFRRGGMAPAERVEAIPDAAPDAADLSPAPPATPDSRAVADRIAVAFAVVREAIDGAAAELGRIDAVAGDGDHGIGMQRGTRAAADAAARAVERGAGAGTTLGRAADAWAERAGGTSGALWGTALSAAAGVLGDDGAPSAQTVSAAVDAAAAAIQSAGGATLGDKTMIDALLPFRDALAERVAAGDDLPTAWSAAADIATEAAASTAALLPRLGRARPHAEHSLGTPDAGATSLALVARAVAPLLTREDAR
ncbi:dihydroxyacetone kinase [Leifsonia naganoensis]|uniref:Dihydroxyacetone kinase n=2 Tax=Leifsonia naganoensis TaxID=150025 RepID=A0A853DQE5_9MICO|nr:dihydroxyacetone kinase [Leifsonia naganoensis]